MKKLRATNPLVLFVGALAIGLAGCADDVIITEPPPPPPPPPPEAAEISIVSFVDADDGTELGESDLGSISGEFGVVVNFDTGGFEAAALDLFVDSDKVACQTFSGQGSVGLAGDVQTVQCIINSAAGVGACQGSPLTGRFANGPHTIAAELTLQDGSTVRATRANPVVFSNTDAIVVVPRDIGPRVVGLDERGWWGGPRDLSWYVCPITFSGGLGDAVCEITVSSSNNHSNGADLALGGTNASPATSVVLDTEPFIAEALYREVPTTDATWADAKSLNEDRVESAPNSGTETVSPTKVLACDGTNITTSFALIGSTRPIDSSAPLCANAPDCQVWIDDDFPITDDSTDPDWVLSNALFSAGDFDLREPGGATFADGGVGFVQGVTLQLNAWDYDDGDIDNLVLYLEDVTGVGDLEEDDACGDGGTTFPDIGGLPTPGLGTYGQCAPTGEAGGVDAYVVQIARVGDLLANELGDGTADQQISDQFLTEVLDAGVGTGVVVSGQLGKDGTAPTIDELEPPASTPLFVWNPDLGFDGTDPLTRTCPSSDAVADCENLMWESEDPKLASGDPGSGVEDGECKQAYPLGCTDNNGDGRLIVTTITDSPADAYNGANLVTNSDNLGADMFQAFVCDGVNGAMCDGTDDGTYTARHRVTDKAMVINNRAEASYSFVIDVTQPVIGFGGITGLNSSNAATVEFVLDASVIDRNGDGTAVTSAIVQVTAFSVGPGDCSTGAADLITAAQVQVTPQGGNDDASGNTVIADVTSQVNADGGDFSQLFTASNLGPGAVTYCFTIIADDGAKRKDGTDDGISINATAGKDFTWQ